MIFFNSQGEWAGAVRIFFSSTPQYYLYYCISNTNFPSTLPTAVDKVWRISLNKSSGITLQIHCNDVEVLNFPMDVACTHNDWRDFWSRDVEKIVFYDTASDYFRPFISGSARIINTCICDFTIFYLQCTTITSRQFSSIKRLKYDMGARC